MSTMRLIVCATDLSPASEPAWEQTKTFARLLDAEVLLLNVVAPVAVPVEGYFPPDVYQQLLDAGDQEARQGLEGLVAGLGPAGSKTTVEVEHGPAAARILAVAEARGADLVVVGTHGRTGLSRVLLGSVADRVIRSAPCPVVTARTLAPGAAGRTRRLARICYAADFSQSARAAWPYAVTLAQAAEAEIDLVHVTPSAIPDRHIGPEALARLAQLFHDQGQAAAEQFLGTSSFPRERVHIQIATGLAGEQIVHWAQSRSADLIVMGTQGWSGLVRWMLGSVAHHVVQTAGCPVLTVGPPASHAERSHAS